jgi:hypothetical protein
MERSSKDLRDVGLALNSALRVQRYASGHYADVGNDSASSLGAQLDPHPETNPDIRSPGEKTLPEGFILDPSAVATLREFFELLDEWDRHNNHAQTHSGQRR